jgi:DNA-binding CsgD family transcriptional regulator
VTNAEIAQRLSISVNTVNRHLTHIYTKTGAANRVQAIRFVSEQRSSR